jgi:hypothetical protein
MRGFCTRSGNLFYSKLEFLKSHQNQKTPFAFNTLGLINTQKKVLDIE